jgi:peptidoglycan/xylan/chitin deacetylase (PgdA/CDA1 family)
LAYHRVGARTAAQEIDLPAELFAAQIAAISARAMSLDTALEVIGGAADPSDRDLVVTFDDGTRDFVDDALPVLVAHRVPAMLYVATAFVDEGREFPHGGRAVSWQALRDAVSTGLVTIGSHTHSHALLDRCDVMTARDELDRSIELISDHVGVVPTHFAYPKALTGPRRTEQLVRDRFRSAAIAGTRPNPYGSTDPMRITRSPIQRSDGMRWFDRKARGGMRLEDRLRRIANRFRYVGDST